MSSDRDDAARTEAVRLALARSGLEAGPAHRCSYLPDRTARDLAFSVSHLPPGVYHSLMDLNFRRSGNILYKPQCEACRQCRQIRVRADAFQPNRTQRRCRRRNADLEARAAAPDPTAEKHELYRRYMSLRHGRRMDDSWMSFCGFLYETPVRTLEVTYRLAGRLVAVGIADLEPCAMSTVYCYFDPDLQDRSLGVYNVLWTIDACRQRSIPWLYLGYYIRDCRKMNYKTAYRPCELLTAEGRWTPAGLDGAAD